MRLEQIRLSDVRRLRELELEFAPGLTVVRGPNEAGKSTVQRAIELALAGDVAQAPDDLDALRAWTGASGAPHVRARIAWEDDDGDVRAGEIDKVFDRPAGRVRLVLDGEPVTDPAEAAARLAEITGVPGEGFYRATASIHHGDLAALATDDEALRERLLATVSGADRGVRRVRRRLGRALAALRGGDDGAPGRLPVASAAVEAAAAEVAEGEAAVARLLADRVTLDAARERRAAAGIELAERRAALEEARTAERLELERTAARERLERYRTAVRLRDEIAELGRRHPAALAPAAMRPLVERLRPVEARATELARELEGELEIAFEAPPEPRWRPMRRIGLGSAAVGAAVTGAIWFIVEAGALPRGLVPLEVGGAIAGAGLLLALAGEVVRRRDRGLSGQLRGDEVDRRLRGKSKSALELRDLEAQREELLQQLGQPSLADAERVLAAEEAHVAQVQERRALLAELAGAEPVDLLQEHRDSAAAALEQAEWALASLPAAAREAGARARLEDEVAALEGAFEDLRTAEARAAAEVEANDVDADEVAAAVERLAAAEATVAALERRARILATAVGTLDAAEAATVRAATRAVEERLGEDLAVVTAGRYRRVRVDDATFAIEVHAPERDGWVGVEQLSRGTLELVHLAARLELVRLLTGDRRPVLVLDDPFLLLDDERAERAVRLLAGIARDLQVVYLTTSDRYDRAAERVVVLPGPVAADTANPEALHA